MLHTPPFPPPPPSYCALFIQGVYNLCIRKPPQAWGALNMVLMHAYFFHNATTPAVINVTFFYVYRPVHTMQLAVHNAFQIHRFIKYLFDLSVIVQKNRMKHIASCLICIFCHWILQFCQKHCLVKLHKLFVTLRILLKLKEHHTSCYRKKLESTNRISTNQILGFSVIPRESKSQLFPKDFSSSKFQI